MKLSKNFTSEELSCKHCAVCKIEPAFVIRLQEFRDAWGKPIKVTSGYRCEEHNKAVGGVTESQHVLGIAADLDISTLSGKDRFDFIKLAFQMFSGVGIAKSFLHVDIRKNNFSTWVY